MPFFCGHQQKKQNISLESQKTLTQTFGEKKRERGTQSERDSHNVQPSFVCTHIATAIHIYMRPQMNIFSSLLLVRLSWLAVGGQFLSLTFHLCAKASSSMYFHSAFNCIRIFHSIIFTFLCMLSLYFTLGLKNLFLSTLTTVSWFPQRCHIIYHPPPSCPHLTSLFCGDSCYHCNYFCCCLLLIRNMNANHKTLWAELMVISPLFLNKLFKRSTFKAHLNY